MTGLRCRLRGVRETATCRSSWHSLVSPPLVIVSGHSWVLPTVWSRPAPGPFLEQWSGLVEYDDSRCTECGYQPTPKPWRRYYGGMR